MASFNVVFNKATGYFTFQDTTDWNAIGVTAANIVGNVQIIAPDGSTHYQNLNPLGTFETGTAQGGSTTTITLASGASSTNNFYKNYYSLIESGTGSGQKPKVTAYNGSSKIASAVFSVAPDNTSDYKFCFNDLFIAASVYSQGAIPLLLDTQGNIVAGTYTFNVFYKDVITNSTYLATVSYDYGFTFPVGNISPDVDPFGSYVKATDVTSYTVNSVTPSLSRQFTLNYPPTVVPTPSPIVVTSAVVSTTTVYTPSTYGAVLETTATWNMGGGVYIVGLIIATESIAVDIDNNLCNLQCCLRAALAQVSAYQCAGDTTLASQLRQDLSLALGYYMAVEGAIRCGAPAKIAQYVALFKQTLNCDDDCTCNDNDQPTLVIPVVGQNTTYSFASADGSIVFTVTPSGSNTDVDAVLNPSLLAAIYDTPDISGLVNIVVTETSPNVFTIQGADVAVGTGLSRTTTGSPINQYKLALANLLSSQVSDVNATTSLATIKSYTLPAGVLSVDGDKIRILASYKLATNSNVKNIRLRWNSSTIVQSFSENKASAAYYIYEVEITRLSSTSVGYRATIKSTDVIGQQLFGINYLYDSGTTVLAANDLSSSTNVIAAQGQGVTTGSDLVCQELSVEIIKKA